jgi:aspartate/methionine/tyrosine aminotransferase
MDFTFFKAYKFLTSLNTMKIELEHFNWLERPCKINLASSGIEPVKLEELDKEEVDPVDYLGIERDNFLVTHGAQEGMFLAMASILERGDKILIPMPEYSPIFLQPKLLNSRIVFTTHDSILYNLNGVKLVVFSNPNNPLGIFLGRKEVMEIVEECSKKGCKVMIDETFNYFVSSRSLAEEVNENLIVVSTTAKICNYTNKKAGYVVGDKRMIRWIREMQNLISPPPLDDQIKLLKITFANIEKIMRRNKEIINENLEILMKTKLDFLYKEYMPFAFVNCSSEIPEELYKRGVLVLPGRFFLLDQGFRLSLGGRPDILKEGLSIICNVLKCN